MIPYVNVTVDVYQIVGEALANAIVRMTLTRGDVFTVNGGGIVPAMSASIQCDDQGHGSGNFFPNALGTQGTQYLVEVFNSDGIRVFPSGDRQVPAVIPNINGVQLHTCLFMIPPLSQADAIYYSQEARDWSEYIGGDVPSTPGSRSAKSWAQEDLRGAAYGGSAKDWAQGVGLIDGIEYSAKHYAGLADLDAQQTALDRVATGQDRAATAADRVQTGLDRTQTGIDKAGADASAASAMGSMLTATAQAALASTMALAASSVAQQDLSGVTAAALHRSPNAVVAQAIYETYKDSDGGAWVGKVDASYVGETLNGTWGGSPTAGNSVSFAEAVARGNLVQSPEDLTNAAWTRSSGTYSTIVAPDGTNTMGQMFETAVNGARGWQVSFPQTVAVGDAFIASCVMTPKGALGRWASVTFSNFFGAQCVFDMTGNGSVSYQNNATGYIQALGGGYYLCAMLAVVPSGANGQTPVALFGQTQNGPQGGSYVGDPTRGVALWRPDIQRITAAKFVNTNPELFPSGSYDYIVDAGWVAVNGATLSQTGQRFRIAGNGVSQPAGRLTIGGLTVGKTYVWTSDFYIGTAASTIVSFGTTSGGIQYGQATRTTDGKMSFSFTATQASVFIEYYTPTATAGVYIEFDNSSLKELAQQAPRAYPTLASTAGTYFQFAGDGKFYVCGSTWGATETFRGNKARFPRVAALVLEGLRLVIYDLLEPGRPMWKVIVRGAAAVPSSAWDGNNSNTGTGVAAIGGKVILSTSAAGSFVFDFAKDRVRNYYNGSTSYDWSGTMGQCNTALPKVPLQGIVLPATGVHNAVAVCAIPDAPVDPVTGIQEPMIVFGTGAGGSIVKPDGSVVNSSSTGAIAGVGVTPYAVFFYQNTNANVLYALQPAKLPTSFAYSNVAAGSTQMSWNIPTGALMPTRNRIGKRTAAGLEVSLFNEGTPTAGLHWIAAPIYSTGWMVGDVRRCMFSDTVTGAAQGVVASDDFSGGVAAWTAYLAAVVTDAGAKMRVAIGAGGQSSRAARGFATVPGARYVATADVVGVNANGGSTQFANVSASNNVDATAAFASSTSVSAPTAGLAVEFTATQATTYIGLGAGGNGTAGSYIEWDNFVLTQVVADRSYKGKSAAIVGTLTRTAVASAAQLVFWGGFSNANYAQEAYSADLDFGTAGFAVPVEIQVPTFAQTGGSLALTNTPWAPTAAQSACFPDASAELITNGSPMAAAGWTVPAGWAFAGGLATHTPGNTGALSQIGLASSSLWRIIVTVSGMTSGTLQVGGNTVQNAATVINANGTYTFFIAPNSPVLNLTPSSTFDGSVGFVSVKEAGPSVIGDRSAAGGGANWQVGVDAMGRVTFTVVDAAATSRTVRSTSPYGGAGAILFEPSLSTSGTLTAKVNGEVVGTTTGAPLGSVSNATAVMTWGNRRQLDAAFIGSIALARPTATVPTEDQSRFMWQQERAMFRDGAQVTLPDSGALVDLDYDPAEDKWKPVSAANESTFVGLVRTASAPVASGSISKVAHKGGMKLVGRTTTNPGVDVTIPPQNLLEALVRRSAEEAAARMRGLENYDWDSGFSMNTLSTGTSSQTIASGGSYAAPTNMPLGATLAGALVSASVAGLPAGTTISALSNGATTVYFSAAATQNLQGPWSAQLLDFILPPGMEARDVFVAGALKREGATKDYTRLFDGFRERVRFGVAQGATAHVRVDARRMA